MQGDGRLPVGESRAIAEKFCIWGRTRSRSQAAPIDDIMTAGGDERTADHRDAAQAIKQAQLAHRISKINFGESVVSGSFFEQRTTFDREARSSVRDFIAARGMTRHDLGQQLGMLAATIRR